MYVIIEGVDGAGKTTVIEQLVKRLSSPGAPFEQPKLVQIAEPSRTSPLGKGARHYFKVRNDGHPYHPVVAASLMVAARSETLHRMRPLVESRTHLVLGDRGFLSTLAYQGVDIGPNGLDLVMNLHAGITMPDWIILLDCPPWLAADRAEAKGDHLTRRQIIKAASGYLAAVNHISKMYGYEGELAHRLAVVPAVQVGERDAEVPRPIEAIVDDCYQGIVACWERHNAS